MIAQSYSNLIRYPIARLIFKSKECIPFVKNRSNLHLCTNILTMFEITLLKIIQHFHPKNKVLFLALIKKIF